MKLLTKHSDYAVRALLFLAKNQVYSSSRKIATKQGIPYQFLRRILQQLIAGGLVVSRGGGQGGFKLIKKPESVSVVDVIKIFQGDVQFSQCMFRRQLCAHRAACVLRREISRIEKIVDNEFRKVTLAKLLSGLTPGARKLVSS
ncbi:MAG: Rrf2 family transcriptional regulator [Candidatus Omnitrophota bacterium]|nr:Rrf2 family transcriptional regulator [Candidatus Omnitrophota bacterium]